MPMRRVLLTGANSLIGSHILEQLLSFDVSVRAVVGSREQARALEEHYSSRPHHLEFAIVPSADLAVPGAFDEALSAYTEPFDTVIHTITADSSEEADCLSRFIHLETDTLINFLRSVKDIATGTRRVVITTSLSRFARWLVDPQVQRSPRRGSVAFNRLPEIDSEYVLVSSQASDNIVHDALWKWKQDVHAQFDLVSLTAPSVYGPSIRPLANSTDLEEANRRIWNLCSNDVNELTSSPPYGIDLFTDVRDLAFASVQAAFAPAASSKRFIISAGIMPQGSVIAEYLVSRFPELGNRVRATASPPRHPPSGELPLEFVDTHLAATVLGLRWYRPVEETLVDLARQIVELHRRKEWKRVIQS